MSNEGRPDYCDPRAYRFFSWVYTGTTTPSGYHWSWNSTHEELQPTAVHSFGHRRPICAYCGQAAYPAQKRHSHAFGATTFSDRGYTCICKGAMDECDWRAQWNALKSKHEDEEAELVKAKPEIPREFYAKVVHARLKEIADEFTRDGYLSSSACDKLDIEFGDIPEGEPKWD